MQPQDEERTGDYGYDMAHEDVRRPRAPHAPEPRPGRAEVRRMPELDRDYGYDEAHPF